MTESLEVDDPEFRAYVPFLYEIAYKLMFRLYCRHRDQAPGENGAPPRCPEIDFTEYTPTTFDCDDRVKTSFTKLFVFELFVNKARMTRRNVEGKMTTQTYNWLQPHHIRAKAYEKFVSSVK